MQAIETLEKFPDEVRAFGFDFSQQPEITSGQTIDSAVISATTQDGKGVPLVFGPIGIAGGLVQALISSGSPATLYFVTCESTTSAGAVIEIVGKLYVLNVNLL